ncbi:acyltransferase family protein [Chryseobacterium lathyri]|uniref:acyltransferase family protein n=1 Tax=Chryseobacterium lathyri TaxID=395933 RepID=UPI0027844F72|nr:acyltransferase [Chryseobacterium lathyri]MDQ0067922.1 peptidoglycan/LPS O-acetylase OafA/YrhL [Chryseobacterium lathyri]
MKLLQRVTSGGKKILYIDGLRFFCVITVFIEHFIDYYCDKNPFFAKKYTIAQYEYIGSTGIYLFFSISGFIIGLPFIRQYLYKEGNVDIKSYFIRRLTRLEPPYIILLVSIFILQVFILQTKSFEALFPHLLASLFYVHNIIYNEGSVINPVLWTLEIEIQFYILAPVFALLFRANKIMRRSILFLLIFFWNDINFIHFEFKTIVGYLPFFLIGFLAADIYMEYKDKIKNSLFFDFLCVIALITAFLTSNPILILSGNFILLVLSSKSFYFIRLLEKKFLYIIGGMCYTIYMLHQKLIYYISPLFSKMLFNNYLIDFLIKFTIALSVVLIISVLFFIFVERPTMKKDWWKYKSFKKLFFE